MTTAASDRSPSANADRSELISTASEVHRAVVDAAGRDQEVKGKSDSQGIFEAFLHSYAIANNAGDSLAYSRLFTADGIWMPPGAEPEYGPEQIRKSVKPYYDHATWSARFTPANALRVAEEWIYGIAHVDVTTTAHADGAQSSFGLTATWLLQRQVSGEWLIARQMWNLKPDGAS